MTRPDLTLWARRRRSTLLLGACSLAPPLEYPGDSDGGAYKELGPWTQAQPADRLPRDSWWTLYDNAELDELQKRLIAGNPTLAAALANYAQARALSDQARAGLFPTLGLSAGVERDRESVNAPLRGPTTPTYYNDNSLQAAASATSSTCGVRFATRSPRARPMPPRPPRISRMLACR